jgi:general secretion pathway protein I
MTIKMPRYATTHQAGFTLIEVVVALAILALSLGVLYESFGWSLRRTGLLRQQETAWLTAQSMLAEIRSRDALQVGTSNGETAEGLKWDSRIAAYALPLGESPRRAFEVTIDVSWGERPAQRVRLQSVETSRVPT